MQETTAKSRIKRPELHADDLSKMTTLMAKRGVVGATAEVFQALVEAFEQEQAGQQQMQMQTIGEVARTLNWFTGEIQALRTRVSELEQERDQARALQGQADETARLRAEKVALQQALQHTQARLEGIQQLLGMKEETDGTSALPQLRLAAPSPRTATAAPAEQGVSLPPGGVTREVTLPVPATPTTRRNRGETTAKIHQVIDALIRWNTSQVDATKQLRISIPTIKGLASALGANYQPAIQAVLQERAAELEAMHSQLMLGTRHNASVPHKDEILRAIAQGELGLEHWQAVRYSG